MSRTEKRKKKRLEIKSERKAKAAQKRIDPSLEERYTIYATINNLRRMNDYYERNLREDGLLD